MPSPPFFCELVFSAFIFLSPGLTAVSEPLSLPSRGLKPRNENQSHKQGGRVGQRGLSIALCLPGPSSASLPWWRASKPPSFGVLFPRVTSPCRTHAGPPALVSGSQFVPKHESGLLNFRGFANWLLNTAIIKMGNT